MKKDITLSLDADLLREVEILATRKGSSVSALVGEQLEKLVRRDRAYDDARRRALDRLEEGYDLGWTPPADRDELHQLQAFWSRAARERGIVNEDDLDRYLAGRGRSSTPP